MRVLANACCYISLLTAEASYVVLGASRSELPEPLSATVTGSRSASSAIALTLRGKLRRYR